MRVLVCGPCLSFVAWNLNKERKRLDWKERSESVADSLKLKTFFLLSLFNDLWLDSQILCAFVFGQKKGVSLYDMRSGYLRVFTPFRGKGMKMPPKSEPLFSCSSSVVESKGSKPSSFHILPNKVGIWKMKTSVLSQVFFSSICSCIARMSFFVHELGMSGCFLLNLIRIIHCGFHSHLIGKMMRFFQGRKERQVSTRLRSQRLTE